MTGTMKKDHQTDLGTAPVGKLLRSMTIPSIVGVMAYNLYNIFDTLFISLGAGINAIGGVSVSFPLFLFLSAVSSTLGSGGASVMSRALGEKNYEKANKTAANTFLVFYTMAILTTVIGLLFLDDLLLIMGITEELLPYAGAYTKIILIGAVTSTGFSSLIRAEGSSTYAMLIWVIPMVTNVVLDFIFILGLHWGVTGAAAATVLSQCISMGMSIYYFFLSGKSFLHLSLRHFIPDRKLISEILLIGIPSFIQMSGMSLSIIIINRFLKAYGGTLPISAYGIASKIYTFFLIPITGLTQGLQPVIGYNKGARRPDRVREALKLSSCISVGYGIAVCVITFLFSKEILRIFVSDTQVADLGTRILTIINSGLLFSGLQYVQAAYFQAVGRKWTSLLLALCNYVIGFLPLLLVLTQIYGLDGVWYALPSSAILTLALSCVLLMKGPQFKRNKAAQ